MKTLSTFAFVAETGLASVSLGALWLSPWPLMVKVSLSCAVVLLALTQDLQGMQRSLQVEQQLQLSDIAFRVLEQRIAGHSAPSLAEAYSEHFKQENLKMVATGSGKAFAMSLLLKYAVWIAGAALCSWFVLPPFITTTSQWAR